ncbi:hypothetical protein KIPB_012044, partial [Kipferlia bialata]
ASQDEGRVSDFCRPYISAAGTGDLVSVDALPVSQCEPGVPCAFSEEQHYTACHRSGLFVVLGVVVIVSPPSTVGVLFLLTHFHKRRLAKIERRRAASGGMYHIVTAAEWRRDMLAERQSSLGATA